MRYVYVLRLGAFVLAVLCAGGAVAAGLGTRWGVWHFRTGFTILAWAAYGGLAAAILGLVAFILDRSSRRVVLLALVTIVLGSLVTGIPWQMKQRAQHVPPIHDITTDTKNPPAFVAILPLRRDVPNPAQYGGPEVAAQQQKAYPDLSPLLLNVSPKEAFPKALEAARAMGWQIVDSNQEQGRIEATDTTLWFGFKDDIVLRVTPAEQGSRIDVRSVSRVGKSDLGTNACRIQAYLRKIMQGSTP
ncbi:MAG TPA: DUF1499 domain-containing protein [Nitrospirales bacterium]|nr:DUF1499 domain-containing protein [Nitrospirales bacterium]